MSAHFKYTDPDEGKDIEFYHIGLIYKVIKFNNNNLLQNINLEDSLGANRFDVEKVDKNNLSIFARYVIDNFGDLNKDYIPSGHES